jgi:hypothetical protein
LRHGEGVLGKVGFVVVDAHVAVVHRQGAIGGVELEGGGDVRQFGGGVGFEDFRLEGAGEEGVIHPEEHVGERGIFGEDCFVEHGARVAALQEGHFGVVCFFKGFDHILTDGEGVVGHDGEGLGGGGRCLRYASRKQKAEGRK